MIDYAGMTRMNGFGRTGRGRLFVCLGVIVLILGLILVKIQLDEERLKKFCYIDQTVFCESKSGCIIGRLRDIKVIIV